MTAVTASTPEGTGETQALPLFSAIGIELEYMIVSEGDLAVHPIADELIRSASGEYALEIEHGPIAWSNELALHVIELKTNGPAPSFDGLLAAFQGEIRLALELLEPFGARLLGSAMHPFMNPEQELRLWPHEYNEVYAAFDRIFDCRGHGWANLQSTHLNLPFAGDAEFGRLHSAIRLVLPLLPVLAASSPFVAGGASGYLDERLRVYAGNCSRIPEITGVVVPEPVLTRADYERTVLAPIYRALAPHDRDGILRHEWVNARGAIARFDRMSIEIRLLDVQECPLADLAIAEAVVSVVAALVNEELSELGAQTRVDEGVLSGYLEQTLRVGGRARIEASDYLAALGFVGTGPLGARAIWERLLERTFDRVGPDSPRLPLFGAPDPARARALAHILERGSLAERMLEAAGPAPTKTALEGVYRRLADCLREGELF